jgi:hypothetical protein
MDSPATVRFRVEIEGDGGFQDRAYFDVPINCSLTGTDTLAPARPDEVADTYGVNPPSLRVTKGANVNADVLLIWQGVPGSDSHDIWRGTLHSLMGGGYDHAINDEAQISARCNLPGGGSPMGQVLFDELPAHPGSHYYVITAANACGSAFDISGSPGTSRTRGAGGLLVPLADRPDGVIGAPQCQ